jgi:TRAP-type C4-dicarboxylate transport system permease small subunit
MLTLDSISDALALLPRLGGWISAGLILMVLALITYSIALRYFLGTPLEWTEELVGYAVVALVSCGLSDALVRQRHIAIDLLTHQLLQRWQVYVALISSAATLAVGLVWVWSTWETTEFNRAFGFYSNGDLEAPIWITQIPLVIGAGLLVLASLSLLVKLTAEVSK